MNEKNLIPGQHKFTTEERQKAYASRKVNSSMRKLAKLIRGAPAFDSEAEILEYFNIPVNNRTVGAVIVAKTAIGAMAGNKDDRRDFMRMTGDDPDVAVKEEDLKLKKGQTEEQNTTIIDPSIEILKQIREARNGKSDS